MRMRAAVAVLAPRLHTITNPARAIPRRRILYLLSTVLSPPREASSALCSEASMRQVLYEYKRLRRSFGRGAGAGEGGRASRSSLPHGAGIVRHAPLSRGICGLWKGGCAVAGGMVHPKDEITFRVSNPPNFEISP